MWSETSPQYSHAATVADLKQELESTKEALEMSGKDLNRVTGLGVVARRRILQAEMSSEASDAIQVADDDGDGLLGSEVFKVVSSRRR